MAGPLEGHGAFAVRLDALRVKFDGTGIAGNGLHVFPPLLRVLSFLKKMFYFVRCHIPLLFFRFYERLPHVTGSGFLQVFAVLSSPAPARMNTATGSHAPMTAGM